MIVNSNRTYHQSEYEGVCTIAGLRSDIVRMLIDRGDEPAKSNQRREQSGLLLFDAVQRANGAEVVVDVVLVDVILVVQAVLQAVRLGHLAQQTVGQALRQVAHVQVAGVLAGLTGRLAVATAGLTDHRRITSVTGRFAVRFR